MSLLKANKWVTAPRLHAFLVAEHYFFGIVEYKITDVEKDVLQLQIVGGETSTNSWLLSVRKWLEIVVLNDATAQYINFERDLRYFPIVNLQLHLPGDSEVSFISFFTHA